MDLGPRDAHSIFVMQVVIQAWLVTLPLCAVTLTDVDKARHQIGEAAGVRDGSCDGRDNRRSNKSSGCKYSHNVSPGDASPPELPLIDS